MEFVIRTNQKHGPYLQELTFIRPTRMISPKAFVQPTDSNNSNNATNDPLTHNSCHLDWGTVDATDVKEEVVCAGIERIAGTGPFKFQEKITADGVDERVIFLAHEEYWGGAPAVQQLDIVRYATPGQVKEALLSEELDVVWGSGVLDDADIVDIQANEPDIQVYHSGDLQNVILLLNSGKAPFDDINVRKTVIHAINKAAIVKNELKGLQQNVDSIFPLEAPYCDVDLTPRWDYDFEKAVLLSCGGLTNTNNNDDNNRALALGLGIGLGSLFFIVAVVAFIFYQKKKKLEVEIEGMRNKGAVEA